MSPTKHILISVAAAFCCAINANAILTIQTTAGKLKEAVGENVTANSVFFTGTINAADFDFIAEEMTNLSNLDLSGVTITAYEGEATRSGRTTSPANVLPEGALMSVKAETIHLPSTLTEIADGALASISAKSITIPAYVIKIGASAFSNATKLESISIPAFVTSIGNQAFSGCSALTSIEILGKLEEIPQAAFSQCTNLSQITLPESLKSISDDAFSGCSALTSISIPQSVSAIGNRAFHGTSLQRIDLSQCSRLTTIGDWAFASINTLTSVAFPPTLSVIGKGAFFNNSSMSIDQLPSTTTEINDFALKGIRNAPENAIAATSVKTIGDYALAAWKGVQKLTLPANLTYMGNGAMAGWTNLIALSAESVIEIPALGADVWKGIDKSHVILTVPQSLYAGYTLAEQWKDFNIQAGATGNDTPAITPKTGIEARFDGFILHITAPIDISSVDIFNADGRHFFFPTATNGKHAEIDTSLSDSQMLIMRVNLSDGSAAALKLSR